MARTDDYVNALNLAAGELAAKDPVEVARLSGVFYDEEQKVFRLDFIGRPHEVTCPDFKVRLAGGGEDVPLTEQVLILHYLNTAKGTPLQGEMITYREVPAGEFYFAAFVKRAEAPMLAAFGREPQRLFETAPIIGGEPVPGQGDASARFLALPRVPVTLIVWAGDDEFEPAGKILFDRSVSEYLSTEDIAWVSGMIVYRLMRLASQPKGGN